ncbi:MAG: hypothetical protein V1759_01575 [bacterium]
MCVIVIKKSDIELPDKDILKNCFDSNKDGCGFTYTKEGLNYLYKGFFDFKSFYDQITEKVKKEYPCIIHFRIATAGKVDEGNCHPFPLTNNVNILRKLEIITSKMFVAHNGIIQHSNYSYHHKLSDTQEFIQKILSDKAIYDNLYDSRIIQELLINYAGESNKFAFLHSQKGILLLGKFEKYKDWYFSNNSYKNKTLAINDYNFFKRDNFNFTFDDEYNSFCDICQQEITGKKKFIEIEDNIYEVCSDCNKTYSN